jgi:hypothetical protein
MWSFCELGRRFLRLGCGENATLPEWRGWRFFGTRSLRGSLGLAQAVVAAREKAGPGNCRRLSGYGRPWNIRGGVFTLLIGSLQVIR